jgi:hypothetical protein
MQSILFWPQNPMLSIAVLWLVSVVLLWAARAPMLDLLRRLGGGLDEGFSAAARACAAAAEGLRERSRAALLAAGSLEIGHKLDANSRHRSRLLREAGAVRESAP